MGLSFIVSPTTAFILYILNLHDTGNPAIATAGNLTDYFAIAALMAISFLSIIAVKRNRLNRIAALLVASFIVYLIPVWIPILIDRQELILKGHILANFLLFAAVIAALSYVYATYKRALQRIDDFYSDDVCSHISWVANSILLFVGLGIIAIISPFSRHYSTWLRVIYLGFQLGVYVYIYYHARCYELTAFALSFTKSAEDDDFIADQPERESTISTEVVQSIKRGVDRWITRRGYTLQGVTLKSLSLELCTNRTYLSSYINMTYGCSFKVWVTRLRINEAKRLLSDNKEYTVSDIASKVGFTSPSSFIHIFRNMEGEPPIKWREGHRAHNL